MHNYNICYSFDSNYVEQFMVSVISILKNANNNESFNIYILNSGLTENDKNTIETLKLHKNINLEYITVNENEFKQCPLLKGKDENFSHYHVTLPTYFRFKLSSLLPNLKTILYLDCDVIVQGSLSELFATSLKDKSVAMIKDVDGKDEEKRLGIKSYYNAGVMLINLDFWRKNNVENQLFDYIIKHEKIIKWQDQDIINCVLQDTIKPINLKWNYQYFSYEKINNEDLKNCVILHLSGRFKPWLIPVEHPIYDIYYFYLSLTPFYKKILEYKLNGFNKFLKDNIGGKETNRLLNVTDLDIKKVYEDIQKVYQRINEREEFIEDKLGEKINELYEEIKSNYSYMDEVKDEMRKDLEYHLTIETDKKIDKLYNDIERSYDYVNQKKEETKNELTYQISQETDKKIEYIYEEITKNYKYTEQLRDEVKLYTDTQNECIKNEIDEIKLEFENETKTVEKKECTNLSTNKYIDEKLNERINMLEEELAICQINLAKLMRKLER